MSDYSQGPGWWQATDGKFYPPEQHPQYQRPLPPPPRPAPPQAQPPAKPQGNRFIRWCRYSFWPRFRRLPLWAQIVSVVIVIAVLALAAATAPKNKNVATTQAGTTTTVVTVPTTPAPPTTAKLKTVKTKLDFDLNRVSAAVATVQITLGETITSPSQANVDQLAQFAQQAHDEISGLRDQIAVDGGNGNLFGAANDVKNSMGALVTYTGNPNPATLASFTTQYQTAVGEWNDAVNALYAGTAQTPPTIATS